MPQAPPTFSPTFGRHVNFGGEHRRSVAAGERPEDSEARVQAMVQVITALQAAWDADTLRMRGTRPRHFHATPGARSCRLDFINRRGEPDHLHLTLHTFAHAQTLPDGTLHLRVHHPCSGMQHTEVLHLRGGDRPSTSRP